ncbi:dienelactone hydrolase family protein [Micromonospora sp. NPDC000089]|uniref:dienelactone hydrolase family protein n=1 Tax=unclassified Micromonospora TaxID=2617518 RepID=UPI003689DE53
MAHVALFHSVFGLRPAVRVAADRLRAAGHRVTAPDLYGEPAADSAEGGFALLARIGHDEVLRRARAAVAPLPPDVVLAGWSMGAGLAGALLADRPAAAGLLLWHGTGGDPVQVRPGLPVQLHLADPDEYEPQEDVDDWQRAMTTAGARLEVFRYLGAGHLFTDPGTRDSDPGAAALTWDRSLAFLAGPAAPSAVEV